METGQLHGDVALQPIIEDVLKNAASAMGRPHATTCEELADLCSMPDARLLRVVCGATCGCTELRTSAWHRVGFYEQFSYLTIFVVLPLQRESVRNPS